MHNGLILKLFHVHNLSIRGSPALIVFIRINCFMCRHGEHEAIIQVVFLVVLGTVAIPPVLAAFLVFRFRAPLDEHEEFVGVADLFIWYHLLSSNPTTCSCSDYLLGEIKSELFRKLLR